MVDQWNCTTTQCNNLVLALRAYGQRRYRSTNLTATKHYLTKTGALSTIIAINVAHNNPVSHRCTVDGNVQWSNNVFTAPTARPRWPTPHPLPAQ